jgi:hypothetical protein
MDEITYSILDLFSEDYYGPWELEVQLTTRSLLIPALGELIGQGLVEWYFRENDLRVPETRPWSELDAPAPRLSDPSTWEGRAPESPQILLGLTAKGEAVIRREHLARSGKGQSTSDG